MDKVLLKKLAQAFGPSGREDEVRAIVSAEAEKLCADVTIDVMGNVTAHRKGNGRRILLCSHMDTCGVVVTEVDGKGFARIAGVGSAEASSFAGRFVRFSNGERAVAARGKACEKPEFKDLFLDLGAQGRDAARAKADIGDMAVLCGETAVLGDRIAGPFVSDRIGCMILLDVLRHDRSDADLYAVFSAQERVGGRGAGAAAWTIMPDFAINVHAGFAGDAPESGRSCLELGAGCAIEIMDRRSIVPPAMRDRLRSAAEAACVPVQTDALMMEETDAPSLQRAGAGTMLGVVSVPCRYRGAGIEVADIRDAENAVRLLNAFLKENA